MSRYMQMIRRRQDTVGRLCVGIDPLIKKIPQDVSPVSFCRDIIDATAEVVTTFKPNIAFFESRGPRGLEEYAEIIGIIRQTNLDIPITGDWKRGDIGDANDGYQQAENFYGIDAMTANPYLGQDTWQRFLDDPDRGLILLCRTSNPGAGEFQDVLVDVSKDPVRGEHEVPFYQLVARNVSRDWNTKGNCGLVMGATSPEEIQFVREIAPGIFLLIPGVGKQGGSLELSVKYAFSREAEADYVINTSGAVLYAYCDEKGKFQAEPTKFAQAAGRAARDYVDQLRVAHEKALEKAA